MYPRHLIERIRYIVYGIIYGIYLNGHYSYYIIFMSGKMWRLFEGSYHLRYVYLHVIVHI